MLNTKVSEVLAVKKSKKIWCLPSEATVRDAVEIMRNQSIGAILVVDRKKLVGIVSERDCLMQFDLHPSDFDYRSLGEIVEPCLSSVTLETTIRECFSLMANQHARYLPVLDKNKLCGLVSIGDIVRALIEDQRFEIQQLMNYIAGYHSIPSNRDTLSTAVHGCQINVSEPLVSNE